MRDVNEKLSERLQNNVTTIATCWCLRLKNDTLLGFTDYAEDMVIDNLKYVANSGFTSSSIESNASFAVDNLEISGFLNSESIKSEDILAGRYDHAYVKIFAVDYNQPELGSITLKTGYLGEITLLNNQFTAEIRGISEKLSNNIGKLYSPTCRAEFCGAECKLLQSSHLETGAVTEVISSTCIKSRDLKIQDSLYNLGNIKFISGKNINLSMSLKECKNNSVTFMLEFPYEICKGDKFIIFAGCDKKFETCCNYYNNAINFRGEPHLPGVDELYKTAGTFK